MDRFCFGVIIGLAIASFVSDSDDWSTMTLGVVVVVLYFTGRFFARKLSNN